MIYISYAVIWMLSGEDRLEAVPTVEIELRPCWRIIPTRVPPVDLFEPIAPCKAWDALIALESRTNERLRHQEGAVRLFRPEDERTGPGASLIMAPFCHPDPNGEIFSNGTFGICIVTSTLDEAIAISVKRKERFLSYTNESSSDFQMRVLNLDLSGSFHDIRGKSEVLFSTEEELRSFGCKLREEGSFGIICDRPVSPKGENIYVFRPCVLSNCRQERHLVYRWNGNKIEKVYDYSTGKIIFAT